MTHITIGDSSPLIHYVANGITVSFSFPFPIFKREDLAIYENKTRIYDAVITGIGDSTGGTATFAAAPAAGTTITLRRELPLARTSDFQTDGVIRAKTLNDELDYQIAALQQVAEGLSRAIVRDPTSTSTASLALPDPAPGRALKWNDDGTALVNSSGDVDGLNPTSAAGVSFVPMDGGMIRSVESRLRETASVLDFIPESLHAGIRAHTNTVDLTAYIQAALDAGVGSFPLGAYRIESALKCTVAVIRMGAGAYIDPQGSGYTALTITNIAGYTGGWNISVHKSDWTMFVGSGVVWENPALANIDAIKVYAIDGPGIRINGMFDCTVGTLSTVYCGNVDHFALRLDDHENGPCNQSVIGVIQCELSNAKALSISPISRHMTINCIHSERTTGVDGVRGYHIGGAWCVYNNIRIQQMNVLGEVFFDIPSTKITGLFIETAVPAVIQGGPYDPAIFDKCQFTGSVTSAVNQQGHFNFMRSKFHEALSISSSNGWLFQDCDIATLSVGYTPLFPTGDTVTYFRGLAENRRFDSCRIGTLTTFSNYAASHFTNCAINYTAAPFFLYHIYDNCDVGGGISCAPTSFLEMRGCRLIGNLIGCWHGQGWIADTAILGSITGDGSAEQPFAFNNVSLRDTAFIVGAPTYGTWHNGLRCDRVPAAQGLPRGWIHSGAAWTALPNL